MRSFAKVHTKDYLILSLAMLIAVAGALSFAFEGGSAAYADGDTYSRVFPTTNYFQASEPTRVVGNDDYLVVYDNAARALMIFASEPEGSSILSLDYDVLDELYIIGSTLLVYADNAYHSLDLANPVAISTVNIPQIKSDCYLTSDGERLYIHHKSSKLTVLDSRLEPLYGADEVETELYGRPVVAASGSELYAFESVHNIYMLMNKLDIATLQASFCTMDYNVQKAYIGEVIYAKVNELDGIACLSKEDGSLLFDSGISAEGFFACNDTVYIIENNSVCLYRLNSDKTALELLSQISMTGSDTKHLNAPSDLIVENGSLLVADSGNSRLLQIGTSNAIALEDKPLAICGGQSVYAVLEGKICKLQGNSVIKEYAVENAIDVVQLEKLYILTDDGVYTLIGDTLLRLCEISGAKRIACAKDGKNIYILTSTDVLCMTPSGELLPESISGAFAAAVDLAVDYEGKIFVAFDNEIRSYLRGNEQAISLVNSSLNATLTSVCLDGDKLYFSARESFVGVLNVNATTKDTYIASQIDISKATGYELMSPKDNALYYSTDNRADNTSLASDDTLLVLSGLDCEDGYAFALKSDKLVKIALTQFNSVQTQTLSGDYVTTEQAKLYTIPYCESGAITLDCDAHVTLLSDTADYDESIWVLVEYDNSTYFAKRNQLAEYIELIPEKDRLYGKANADRVGGIVNVYASPDTNSDIKLEIVDGTSVEVLEELDSFYLVSVDSTIGYIQKAEVKIDGLTTVQVIAIVLAIIVALAGIAIFASIHLTKKNSEDKENGKNGSFIR